jgi:integrase
MAGATTVPFSHTSAIDTVASSGEQKTTVDLWAARSAGITVGGWTAEWKEDLDVSASTETHYRHMFRRYILPYWASTGLTEITDRRVRMWARELHIGRGLAASTVDGIVRLFARLLAAAVTDGHLQKNPVGRLAHRPRCAISTIGPARLEPYEIVQIADQVAAIYGDCGAMLIVTAAWTGARWGELVALRRANLHVREDDTGALVVDPNDGAAVESGTELWLTAPKAQRTIPLPPFLVRLLRAHLTTHDHPHVFVTPEQTLPRRDAFRRRALRPAADGNLGVQDPRVRLYPIKPGLTFHEFRHSHRAWIGDEPVEHPRQRDLSQPTKHVNLSASPGDATVRDDDRRAMLQGIWDEAVQRLPQPHEHAWRRAAS